MRVMNGSSRGERKTTLELHDHHVANMSSIDSDASVEKKLVLALTQRLGEHILALRQQQGIGGGGGVGGGVGGVGGGGGISSSSPSPPVSTVVGGGGSGFFGGSSIAGGGGGGGGGSMLGGGQQPDTLRGSSSVGSMRASALESAAVQNRGALVRQNVHALIQLSAHRIGTVVQALLHLADNIDRASGTQPSVDDPSALASAHSRIFLLRVIYACLAAHRRASLGSRANNHALLRLPKLSRSHLQPSAANVTSHIHAFLQAETSAALAPLFAAMVSGDVELTPGVLDKQTANGLFQLVLHSFAIANSWSTIDTASGGATLSTSAVTSEDGYHDFYTALGISTPTIDLVQLSMPPASIAMQMRKAAGRIIFDLSQSCWPSITKQTMTALHNIDDNTADILELRILAWCHVEPEQIQDILKLIAYWGKSVKKGSPGWFAVTVRKVLWNWMEIHGPKVAELEISKPIDEQLIDSLFELFGHFGEKDKRKGVMWPVQLMLLFMFPDAMKAIQKHDISTKKKQAYVTFYDGIISSLRNGRNLEYAVICMLDLCNLAVTLQTMPSSPLVTLANEIEHDLKERLLARANASEATPLCLAQLADFLVARYEVVSELPMKFVTQYITPDSVSINVKIAVLRSIFTILTKAIWKVLDTDCEPMKEIAAKPLRSLLLEFVIKQSENINLSPEKKTSLERRARKIPLDETNERNEVILHILKIYHTCPEMVLKDTDESISPASAVQTLTRCLNHSSPVIRTMTSEILLELHQPSYLPLWNQNGNEREVFWRISCKTVTAVAQQILLCSARDEVQIKYNLELVIQLFIKRDEFLAKNERPSSSSFSPQFCNEIERMLLVLLCSVDKEIATMAMVCLDHLCAEAVKFEEFDDTPILFSPYPILSNIDVYRQFLNGMFHSETVTGRVAQQKKVRKMLRSIPQATDGAVLAWEEVYQRWLVLTSSMVRPTCDDANSEDKRTKFFSNRFTAVAVNPARSFNSLPTGDDDKIDWQNYTGFLCALGGCCLGKISATEHVKSTRRSVDVQSNSSMLQSSSTIKDLKENAINKFMDTLLDLLVSEIVYVREAIKDVLGMELSPGLYTILFRQFEATLTKLFDNKFECTDRATLHVEQAISVLRLILERAQDIGDENSFNVDFEKLILSYVKYLQRLGNVHTALRIKIKLCQLIEILTQKSELISFRQEIKFRNNLLEILVDWTSDALNTFDLQMYVDEHNVKTSKMHRDLDQACLKAITALLQQLPLQPGDKIRENVEISDARSIMFEKYFQFFVHIMDRCKKLELQIAESSKKPFTALPSSKIADLKREFGILKEYAVLALSNLLSANIDCGLKISLAIGYHDDSKTRTAFMRVMTNILNQGAEFEGLAETHLNDRYEKLVTLVVDPTLGIGDALAEAIPTSESEDAASLLLTIFEARNESLNFLRSLLIREIGRAESSATVLRRNSLTTKFLVAYARLVASDFLRCALEPALQELLSPKDKKSSFEIDPDRIQNEESVEENLDALETVSQKFVDSIIAAADFIPDELRYVSWFIVEAMAKNFPDSDTNIAVGALIFLRFLCPVIVAPDMHFLTAPIESVAIRRCLTMITKIIQNLANGVVFGNKESFMVRLNPFLERNLPLIMQFLESIPRKPTTQLESELPCKSVEENDLRKLHRYVHDNMELIGKELAVQKQNILGTMRSPLSSAFDLKSTTSLNHRSTKHLADKLALSNNSVDSNRRAFDVLSTLMVQLGPITDTSSKEHLNAFPVSKLAVNQFYSEFMSRYDGRDVSSIRDAKIFYEGGVSKERRPVLYYIARKVKASVVDTELLIYYIFTILKTVSDKPFDVVIDITGFSEESELQNQWIQQFLQILPYDVAEKLGNLHLHNVNSAFRRYCKKLQRLVPSKLSKKFHFSFTISDLADHIVQPALPKSTLSIEQDPIIMSFPGVRITHNGPIPVTLKLCGEHFHVMTAKKMEFIGTSTFINDIFHISAIELVEIPGSAENKDEFIFKHDHGAASMVLGCSKRDQIVQALKAAQSKLVSPKPVLQVERTIRPNDVPGTLLNMALLNLGSEDPDLRLAAYELLSAIGLVFKFNIGNQVVSAKGLLIPNNSTSFIIGVSKRLAATAPHLTLEFLRECFVGFNQSTTELKHLCLEYMVPWLSNLVLFLRPAENNRQDSITKAMEVLRLLIDLTVQESEMYPSVQSKVWFHLGEIEEMVQPLLFAFIEYAAEHGAGTRKAEIVADTVVTLASANIHLISGKILARLRKVIQSTWMNPTHVLSEHSLWSEICVLLRFCLTLSFNNRLNVAQFLPDVFDVVTMVLATGSSLIRATVHGILINVIQSLCTSLSLNEDQLRGLRLHLAEFSEPKYRLLFGISRNTDNAFNLVTESFDNSKEKVQLSALETVILSLLDVINISAESDEMAWAWKARWMSLISSRVFHFNPAIQPRAFIAIGCLAISDMDDDLVYQVLNSLRVALLQFDEIDCVLINSILMCLTNLVNGSSSESKYLRPVFWIAMALIQMDHVPIFAAALNLVQAVIKNLSLRGSFYQESPHSYLLRSQTIFKDVYKSLERLSGISFETNFAFAVASLLLKGLKHAPTKAITTTTIVTFLEVCNKFLYQSRYTVDLDEDVTLAHPQPRGHIDSSVLGYVIVLLPFLDKPDVRELLWIAGIEYDELERRVAEQRTALQQSLLHHRKGMELFTEAIPKIYHSLSIPPDHASSALLLGLLSVILESTEHEQDALFIYNFLGEFATTAPEVVSQAYERLLPKLTHVLSTSHHQQVVQAVHRILQVIVSSRPSGSASGQQPQQQQSLAMPMSTSMNMTVTVTTGSFTCLAPKDGTTPGSGGGKHVVMSSVLKEKGFSSLMTSDMASFDCVPKSRRMQMANLTSALVEMVLKQ